jgi:hypothetical protein
MDAYTDENPRVRASLCQVLGSFEPSLITFREEMILLNALLHDPSTSVRIAACYAWAGLNHNSLPEKFEKILSDIINGQITDEEAQNGHNKVWACRALTKLTGGHYQRYSRQALLWAALRAGKVVKAEACAALQYNNSGFDESEMQALRDIINNEPNEYVKIKACQALVNASKASPSSQDVTMFQEIASNTNNSELLSCALQALKDFNCQEESMQTLCFSLLERRHHKIRTIAFNYLDSMMDQMHHGKQQQLLKRLTDHNMRTVTDVNPGLQRFIEIMRTHHEKHDCININDAASCEPALESMMMSRY